MKSGKLIVAATLATLCGGAPAHAQTAGQVLKGTATGAGGGALAGAITPGVSPGDGAAHAGLVKNRKYHRDGRHATDVGKDAKRSPAPRPRT